MGGIKQFEWLRLMKVYYPENTRDWNLVVSTDKQGPVVQSIVSLTILSVKDLLSLLAHTKSSLLIFFAEKNEKSFCTAKAPRILPTKRAFFFLHKTCLKI